MATLVCEQTIPGNVPPDDPGGKLGEVGPTPQPLQGEPDPSEDPDNEASRKGDGT